MNKTLATILTAASTWWGGFCERNLISDSPEMAAEKNGGIDQAYAYWLIEMYKYTGLMAAQGDLKAARQLRYLGDELRGYGIGQDAIEDYGRFER